MAPDNKIDNKKVFLMLVKKLVNQIMILEITQAIIKEDLISINIIVNFY